MTAATTTSTTDRLLGPLLRHVDGWAPVWFGAIFWGSVLLETGRRIWPDASAVLLGVVAVLIGASAGFAARRRGYWL